MVSCYPFAAALIFAAVLSLPQDAIADPSQEVEEITVRAERLYRSRETMPSPTLVYTREFFQRFEPVAVGDMLKRVSSVAFTGDIGEFDQAQLRGLAPQYTQILVNGERLPGASADRSIMVNRIPAELVERIEIIRSPGPELDAQGVGGTINIVLRDGAALRGGTWRLTGTYYDQGDSEFKGAASMTYGGETDRSHYSVSANYQERLTPKSKREVVFNSDREPEQISDSVDVRETTDGSLSANLDLDLDATSSLRLEGSYINTEIEEEEMLSVLDGDGALDEQRLEQERIDQDRTGMAARYERGLGNGMGLRLRASASRFQESTMLREAALEDGELFPDLVENTETDDDEVTVDASLFRNVGDRHAVEFGLQLSRRERDRQQRQFELNDEDELEDSTPGNGNYQVEERRIDAYVKDTWMMSDSLTLEYGVRLEDTDLDQRGDRGVANDRYRELNPSAHLIFQPGATHQFRLSVAQTIRRPEFDEIIPFADRDSPSEDQVTIGNPDLRPEIAVGLDLGYELRFRDQGGIFGANLFYRDVDDVIELTEIGEDLFTPDNVGQGETWGVELDLSTPLTVFELPNVGVYANYTWLDSEIRDPFTGAQRRFNLQPDYVANLDLIHDLPGRGFRYGLSYQTQGPAVDHQATEIKRVEYDGNLELFAEKELGDLVIRVTLNNVLDARKTEFVRSFDTLDDRIADRTQEFVQETEQSGPVLLLTLRGTF